MSRNVQKRPSAAIIYGVPGIGKTSLAAHMVKAFNGAFLIDKQEDGINRLKESGLVPADIPVFPPVAAWDDILAALEELRTGKHDLKALAIDALGGFERLCHEEVCRRDYNNEWGERGFTGYARGYEVSLADWRQFIIALDALRDERQMSILLLAHAKVSPFKNPEGPDYDKYNCDVHHKTWSLTHKWADMVLFANYEVVFDSQDVSKSKAKAKGGQVRMLYTEHHAAYDAKNRANLDAEIPMGSSGEEAWDKLAAAIKAGRKPHSEKD